MALHLFNGLAAQFDLFIKGLANLLDIVFGYLPPLRLIELLFLLLQHFLNLLIDLSL